MTMTTIATAPTPHTAPASNTYDGRHDPLPASRPVVLRLTPEHVRTFHRSIPILVREVRRQLAGRRPEDVHEVVVDLIDVPLRHLRLHRCSSSIRLLRVDSPTWTRASRGNRGQPGDRRRIDPLRPTGKSDPHRYERTSMALLIETREP